MKIGINTHLQLRLIIEELKKKLELKTIHLNIAKRKLKKYENTNI
jgi:hypothetical protein|tara:strand:+ start:826 stop:960 length:135 start_codon:yes stop_codon:yes gene_type:complete